MKAFRLTILITGLVCCEAFAQDPHFTQYFASPLSLNPASTGFIDGKYRISTNYRQQWWNVGEPYNTGSFSLDLNLLSENTAVKDKFGVGVMAIHEESLNRILKSTYLALSTSYHKQLAEDNTHNFGVGLQAAYSSKRLDHSRLSFASQFTGNGFDLSIPTDLSGTANSAGFFDVNAGLLYSSFRSWGSYYSGLSVYHLTKPTESIFSPSGEPVKMRQTIHAGATVNLNEFYGLLLSGVFMKQGRTDEVLAGSAFSIQGTGDGKLFLGVWYRLNESIIPYVGYDVKNLSFGLNYGIAVPNITNYRPRTMELSLIFRKPPTNKMALCPRF